LGSPSVHAAQHEIRLARHQLVDRGVCAGESIGPRVARSWQRSLDAGLLPMGRISHADMLSGLDLERARERNHALVSHSLPVMEFLFDGVRDSHSMVILADRNGSLMHTHGDLDFLGKAERVALRCGASWHESQRGTNAIGTALAERGEVEIHGAEHFLERNTFLTCAASPILSGVGELLGILDISGDQRSRHPHTLGLVSTAARMIENSLLLSEPHAIVLRLHPRPEGIDTVAEGILALSEDGWIVGANRRALALLGIEAGRIGGVRIQGVFDARIEDLVRAGSPDARPFALRTAGGAPLLARVQLRASLAPAAPSRPVAPLEDALSRLDSGDPQWRRAAERARRVLSRRIPLLVQGESGVGKELFARALHESTAPGPAPFVAINCAALPENLIESELFGYAPGAFTGARAKGCTGRLREAHGGTLFLDEIGDMPLGLQARLLRVLQERKVTPLGCGEAVDVDFSLICATHRRLRAEVEAGRFREDLYYRINGLSVTLPALRERTDFHALVNRRLREICQGEPLPVEAGLLEALSRHPWPGNLRQLDSVLRASVAMLEAGDTRIGWHHLPDEIFEELRDPPHVAAGEAAAAPPQNLQELSQRAIEQALENWRGNVSAAARQLGISRQTLYRRIQAR